MHRHAARLLGQLPQDELLGSQHAVGLQPPSAAGLAALAGAALAALLAGGGGRLLALAAALLLLVLLLIRVELRRLLVIHIGCCA